MAIAYQAAGAGPIAFSATSSVSIDSGASADRAIIGLGAIQTDATKTVASVKYNNVDLTLDGSSHNGVNLTAFKNGRWGYLTGDANVASGANNAVTTSSGTGSSEKTAVLAAAYSGVGSVGNADYVDAFVAGGGNTSVNVTTVAGDTAVLMLYGDGANAVTCSTGGTVRDLGTGNGYRRIIIEQVATGTTTTITFSHATSGSSWYGVKFALTPAGGGSKLLSQLMSMY